MADPHDPLSSMNRSLMPDLLSKGEEITCRHCGSTDVRPSQKSTCGTGRMVYRCRSCKQHFKVATGHPRLPMILGISLFLLVAGGALVRFLAGSAPTDADPPRSGLQNPQAQENIRQRARQGDAQAQYDLGHALWQRDEYAQALPWLRAAATRGHAEAQFLLGQAYQYGRGTVQNFRAAQEQFIKAAEQGHLEAQYQLGIFLRDGLAGLPDREAAYVWLNLAAARGHPDALALRDKLTLAMTGEEILRAQEASSAALKRLESRLAQSATP